MKRMLAFCVFIAAASLAAASCSDEGLCDYEDDDGICCESRCTDYGCETRCD